MTFLPSCPVSGVVGELGGTSETFPVTHAGDECRSVTKEVNGKKKKNGQVLVETITNVARVP